MSNNQSNLIEPEYSLRHYQRVPAKEIIERMIGGERRILFHAPTGAGKTRTAMSVVSTHLRLHGPTMVLWLASTQELVGQAGRDFRNSWAHHGDIKAMLVEWRGEAPAFDIAQAPNRNTMIVAGVQFLSMLTNRNNQIMQTMRENITLMVFDEAHQSVAPTYKDLVEKVMNKSKCNLLGLSATPGRSEGDNATKALAEMYHHNKVTIDHSPDLDPITFLVRNGYLANPHFKTRPFSGNDADATLYGKSSDSDDYSEDLLGHLGDDILRNARIVDLVYEAINAGHNRILVFVPSIRSAESCHLLLQSEHEIRDSFVLSGKTDKNERANTVQRYSSSSDHPHVIFNVKVLTAGFDAPKTSAVVIAKPTKSLVLYSQIVGRALRGPKSGGNENATIYTLTDDACSDFIDVVETFSHWDKLWTGEEQ